MQELAIGFGLFLFLEGLLYAVFPGGVKRVAMEVPKIPESTLRNFGIIVMMIGVAVIWLVKGTG
ncbi:MAG: DUF2065 domain-containing protein [Salaquimonas sp.]|jgi:hypothetical protein|nr:DUF2065 domain-containing protein [Salaquimonas sp.]